MQDKHPANYGAAFDMLYICGCAMNDIEPNAKRISCLNYKELYSVSSLHKLTALVAAGLENSKAALPVNDDKYCALIFSAKERSARKNLMFSIEREKIFSFFNKNGIWHLPLKGTVLEPLYPKLGVRQMVDNDILFDITHRKKVHDLFVSLGYDVFVYDESKHDIYHKAPFYNFEMHVDLFGKKEIGGFYEYYASVKDRLIPVSDSSYEYRFSNEDFYCYFLSHAYSHKSSAGIGVRFLCDLWIFLKSYSSALDMEYISGELKKLGIEAFEKESRELVYAVFSDPDSFSCEKLSYSMYQQLTEAFESGTYGTTKQQVEKGIVNNGGKLRYLISCIFPQKRELWHYFPPCKKHSWLLPVGWLWRILYLIFRKTKYSFSKLKYLVTSKDEADG